MLLRNRNDFVSVLEASNDVLGWNWLHLWVVVYELDRLVSDRVGLLVLVKARDHGILLETRNLMVAGFCVTHNPYFKLGADLQSASVLRRKAEDFFLERSLNLKGVAGVKDLH